MEIGDIKNMKMDLEKIILGEIEKIEHFDVEVTSIYLNKAHILGRDNPKTVSVEIEITI